MGWPLVIDTQGVCIMVNKMSVYKQYKTGCAKDHPSHSERDGHRGLKPE